MFIGEDDCFKLTPHQQSSQKPFLNQSSTFHSNNKSFQKATLNFQPSFTDFPQTISKCLYKAFYLQNQSLFNPFCPICIKIVNKNQPFTFCKIISTQIYLIHDKCLFNTPSFGMSLAIQQEDDMLIAKSSQFKNSLHLKNMKKDFDLQSRSFWVEISFHHPLSQKRFGKVQKKIQLSGQRSYFQVKLTDEQMEDGFSPNIVALPLTDYKIDFMIHQIGQDCRTKFSKYINLKKVYGQFSKEIIISNKELQIFISISDSEKQKQIILDGMNYKYAYKTQNLPLVLIQEIYIQIPEIFKEQQSGQYDDIIESSSSKVLQFLQLDAKIQQDQSYASRKTSRSNISFQSIRSNKDDSKQSKAEQATNNDYQKVNLQKLLKTDTLKSFVKHNTQSRSFQSFLQKASYQQIDKIIQHMKGEFVDLMKHQYGNYMMQKLFAVCNLERRFLILEILVPQTSDIVMNKQGTHAFQDFLSFFTCQPEYSLVLNKIRQNFYELCIHNNATHFIQKIIKLFPMYLLNQFFYYCVQNIYQFSCDKNGMCVIKYMLKKIKEILDKKIIVNLSNTRNQQCYKLAQQYQKLFPQATLFNLDAIIADMYGNYVVQFNFQLFDNNLTSMLMDSILMKLPQYSLSKYSTNVVFKCLNTYWINQRQYVSSVLKQVFQPYLILEMYKNKDGNKILLQIMERYEGLEIWNRIYNNLINTEPTRFYHDRWGVCLGSRSGTVGGNWSSFSDAVERISNKKKNNKLF